MDNERQENTTDTWTEAIREQEETSKEHNQEQEDRENEIYDKLRRFLDIPLEVEVVIGTTTLTLGELLHLGQGSVIELEQNVETPVDIKVNGKLVAKGEIVIVEDKFGIRIIEIIAEEERIKKIV
ncbi:MAG: flagellar motor switch protein FliN [Archaeoglobaceae archaeon]